MYLLKCIDEKVEDKIFTSKKALDKFLREEVKEIFENDDKPNMSFEPTYNIYKIKLIETVKFTPKIKIIKIIKDRK